MLYDHCPLNSELSTQCAHIEILSQLPGVFNETFTQKTLNEDTNVGLILFLWKINTIILIGS